MAMVCSPYAGHWRQWGDLRRYIDRRDRGEPFLAGASGQLEYLIVLFCCRSPVIPVVASRLYGGTTT